LEHEQSTSAADSAIGEALAEQLDALTLAADQLSDSLSMRYFTHVGDVSRQTMAL
jgi:hypothetical protein